jgi:hypothetical protein
VLVDDRLWGVLTLERRHWRRRILRADFNDAGHGQNEEPHRRESTLQATLPLLIVLIA